MKIYTDLDLNTFNAWSGAVDTLNRIREEDKVDELEAVLDELYPDGMSDTELNDLLWFDSDAVYEWLGMKTDDELESEATEAEEELAEAKKTETFDYFCGAFSVCEHCPLNDLNGSCKELWKKWKEEPSDG